MTHAIAGVLIGLVSGVLSGLFGIGGATVMTPAIQVLLGVPPIVALATPLPVVLPTAFTGALTYRRARELDERAAGWMVVAGLGGTVAGAALTEVVNTHFLLVVTAILLAWQALRILRGGGARAGERGAGGVAPLLGIGLMAGLVSGLLGIGGGIVIVPLLTGWLGMPLKRALGTSLAAICALVVPGTAVHAALGHIDWALFLTLVVGAVPGAAIGARIALGTREHILRVVVGSFMLVVSIAYGAHEIAHFLGG